MSDLQVMTITEGRIVLADTAVQQLRARLRGELLLPSDARYDDTRKVWNGMVDKRPALIFRCAGVADVIHAVKFARDHNLLVSVRGGGHNIAGKAVCDGGLMIDLARMRSVHVDLVKRTARVEGGATLGDLDHETQAFGLATTAGVVTHTGVASAGSGGSTGWRATTCFPSTSSLPMVNSSEPVPQRTPTCSGGFEVAGETLAS